MKIRFHHSDNIFDTFSRQWESLLQESYIRSPFQTPAFLNSWWETCGGGEWQGGELWVAVREEENGNTAGIAPLFAHQNSEEGRVFQFLGSKEIADYLDFIVREEDASGFIQEVLDALAESVEKSGAVVDLYNLMEESPGKQHLIKAVEERGWNWTLTDLDVCPYISLESDWEGYLAGLKKKNRHEIRRKNRRLYEAHPDARFEVLQGRDVLRQIQAFLELMRQDPEKEKFLTGPMEQFFHTLSESAAESGWLRLAVLQLEGRLTAAYLIFDYQDTIWLYNSGFDPAMYHLSPGWVLLGELIRWGIENGYKELDFMRGNEDYKYRFGGVDRGVQRLRIGIG